ncbi:MAG: UDP-3-O-(3-hydroxymyristoyl)glucosamine N-acyltransferase [Acetobacteraceae bacterium]|nr:UDP-3-O-(3-hydroxymyristoyl)glucosamine N-acyltransferase [Acetobacteraceae bacterium]
MSWPAQPGDPRFFARSGPHGLAAVLAAAGDDAAAEGEILLHGIAPLQAATADTISFLDNRRYLDALKATAAGAVLVHPAMAAHVPAGTIAICTRQPYLAWARVAALFHPPPPARPGIHRSAVVDPAARVDPSAEIGPLAVVEAGAEIGPRCRIGPLAVVGAGVVLGADCRIGAGASVSHALLGARVYLYPGSRVGQEGFGFATGPAGFVTVPQLGRVLIGDDVELGANSTIDRGSSQDTVIGAGTRIDNLVQIGHNVRLGRCCVIVAQAGISGSAVLGDFVQVGGQAGITGHLAIGDGARIGAKSGVMADVPAKAEVLGAPAMPARQFFREHATMRRMIQREQASRSAAAGSDHEKPETDRDQD